MKIIIKTVKVVIGEFEVQPEDTILQLKQQIAEHENIGVECISLIFKSKMLKDDTQTLGQVNVHDGDNIVIVVKKPAQTAKPAAKPVEAPKPTEPAKPVEQPQPTQTQPTQPVQQSQPTQPSGPATEGVNIFQDQPKPQTHNAPEPSEENIQMLMGMGFGREESRKALRKTRDNVEIAANLLLEGANLDNIPDPEEQEPQAAAAGNFLAQLLANKEQFIQAVTAMPEQFEQLYQIIEQRDPGYGRHCRSNPELFYDVLASSLNPNMGQRPQQPQQQQQRPQYQPAPQAAPQPAGNGQQLSQEDEEAIGRLQQLGFSRNQCVQAYLITDKNETLAANYLLDGLI